MSTLWRFMKELKEKTFNEKSDDFTKAVSYCKKLLKQKLYHSKTVESKLKDRYTPRVVGKTMKYLESHSYFDNDLYVKKLKKLCMNKFYGKKRFKKMLNDKGIYNKENCYTYEEEEEILLIFLDLVWKKYSHLETIDYLKKLKYLLHYKGFSKTNAQKYIQFE